ncbi:MAG: Glyceraldehyde-3-phosphate dehydrogenase [Candidatus Doudnabacteria bacterium Gr01-1014_77]|uniref:Glyceraldehyde-3-phosphate dehydrogenase n=1 Tax=Candidatus Doudnabacteria bacterium Gr01-1014_77 TaxID=2017133 RepID=A0A554JCZ5_9BACT|nr:MAG: Glyceraldehyde-3-phosphate dehydrogenase [Candidatus Doudnabacteria bacterium Gr01-1014_77]
MEKINVAINGFGRIGRQAFKIALEKKEIQIVAINDLASPQVLAHLLKYDSNYGIYSKEVSSDDKHIIVDGEKILVLSEKDPSALPWKKMKVDVVIESTGRFNSAETAGAHIKAGAKKVVISSPAKDEGETKTFVLSVNDKDYNGEPIISNASCTTNCITPVAQILEEKFGIKKIMMTTIHSYTAEQNLVDGPPPGQHSTDLRRARAAAQNIVPTSTGATIAATEAIPNLKGLFHGLSIRVPTAVGSLSDFVALLEKKTTKEELNQTFLEASKTSRFKGILSVSNAPLVSSDIVGNPSSAIVDLGLTEVIDGDFVKVVAWYDNEFGYSNRLVEEVIMVAGK